MKILNKSFLIDIILLLVIGTLFSFYHLEKLYGFEFDQERDFNIVKSMVVERKFSLIGPRVVSSSGFFLGPWYYYLQIPFYISMHGDPLYGAVFTGFTSIVICLLIYIFLRRETSSRLISLLAAINWVSGANRSNWNVAFVPLFFLFFLNFYRNLEKKNSYLNLWFLTLVLFTSLNFHPQMVFILPVWGISIFQYLKKKRLSLKEIIFLIFAIIGPFIPLVIFDLRHNFVNILSAVNFLGSSSSKNSAVPFFRLSYSLRQFSTSLVFIYQGFQHNLPLTGILLTVSFIFCAKNIRYLFLIFITFLSIVVLSFYREPTWPEYYHFLSGFSLFILIYVAAGRIKFVKWLLIPLTLFVVWGNFQNLTSYINPGSYFYKKSMILWMLNENKPYDRLNIENSFAYGDGLGFLPIREYYEKPIGVYNPKLFFFVSTVDNPKHNQTKQTFGKYAISYIREK